MSPREILGQFRGKSVLVLGDVMLDEYIFGKATRISQEAPVMVVRQTSTRAVPGGAANVAANIFALGGSASLIGVVGDDLAGATLEGSLSGLRQTSLIRESGRPTTRKLRVLANHSHQVLRIDHEEEASIRPETEELLLKSMPGLLEGVHAVLISDYRKGCATERIIRESVANARQAGVPVLANPKPESLSWYKGASLVSLNRYEAGEALGKSGGISDEEACDAACSLRDKLEVERVLVTLGASGLAACGGQAYRVPAAQVAVYDEAGAGDTVIAVIALGLACGVFDDSLLRLATQAASAVVQKVGVATPTAEDLAKIV